MQEIQQTVFIDDDRRTLRLEKPLPCTIGSGRMNISFLIWPYIQSQEPDRPSVPVDTLKSKASREDSLEGLSQTELINRYADELNAEAADVHLYQEYSWEHYGSPWDHD
jgi:hypothetical protein